MSEDAYPQQPLSADSLILYRITHPDKDIRPLISRIHKLCTADPAQAAPEASPATENGYGGWTTEEETEMAKLELVKWQRTMERILASAVNLQNQKLFYEHKTKQTVARTEELRKVLEEQKQVLTQRQRERKGMAECDVVARSIRAKGKSRAELDEQIVQLQQSLKGHRATNETYLTIAQSRSDKLKQVIKLVEEVRGMKLPDLSGPIEAETSEAMDVDEREGGDSTEAGGSSARLNVTALPFQPAQTSQSTAPTKTTNSASTPATRASSPAPPASTSSNSRHALPSRPSRSASSTNAPATRPASGSHLPSRPSALRTVTLPKGGAAASGSLEEGEVGGEEEGEVEEKKPKRGAAEKPKGRTTRNRA